VALELPKLLTELAVVSALALEDGDEGSQEHGVDGSGPMALSKRTAKGAALFLPMFASAPP